jgi:hypothetical protein
MAVAAARLTSEHRAPGSSWSSQHEAYLVSYCRATRILERPYKRQRRPKGRRYRCLDQVVKATIQAFGNPNLTPSGGAC